jgi:hypothetical protein
MIRPKFTVFQTYLFKNFFRETPDIRPFLYPVSGRIPYTENGQISGQFEDIAILIVLQKLFASVLQWMTKNCFV